jgi:adenylate cyclase
MLESFTHVVQFDGDGFVNVYAGQSLLHAALTAGINHVHVCGGTAKCSTCRVLVLEGAEFLSAPNEQEKHLKNQMHFPLNVRLACQTTVNGEPVKLTRIIQDESDIDLYVGKDCELSSQQIGEELELALFFFDIRNFTSFTETHLAFDVIHIIRKLFSNFQTIIESNKGEIIETMGDGFYAVFGGKGGSEAGVSAAVQCGLAIIKELDFLNKTYFKPVFNEVIEAGIGLHTGRVISGEIRVGSVYHRVVMGLPVNIAARLQNATKELNNSFIVSAEAYNYLPQKLQNYPSAFINPKGITDKVEVYLLGKPYSPAQ